MKKVSIVSLGCAKNLVDSENILGLFKHFNYEITANLEDSDLIIVNTCGFINSAKKESIDTILDIISYKKKVVVTGCLVERYLDDLKKSIPEVDTFIPIRDYDHFAQYLEELNSSEGLNDKYRCVSTGDFSAYLKIGEGCDNRCSYCAIPIIRGGFVSRPLTEIVAEANELANKGYKELIVLEQDTTKYGIDLNKGENIVLLLKKLLEIKKLTYIRLLYLYPDEITDELIDLIATEPRLTPYFDIPIQHSEDKILSLMNRRGGKEYLRTLFNKIRTKVPNAVLRTTVMVGFPGETKTDFKNLLDFIQEVKFDHLGAFKYSKEEGTESFNFKGQISERIKDERLDQLMKTQQSISYSLNKKHINEVMEGLVIGYENNLYKLRSYWNAPDDVDGNIYFTSPKKLDLGDIVKIQIDKAFVYDLYGHIL